MFDPKTGNLSSAYAAPFAWLVGLTASSSNPALIHLVGFLETFFYRCTGTPQGLSANSTWARGQGWGIYGTLSISLFQFMELNFNHCNDLVLKQYNICCCCCCRLYDGASLHKGFIILEVSDVSNFQRVCVGFHSHTSLLPH